MTPAVRLYLDFDGTVTTEDVGNAFFRTFGGPVCDGLVARYRAGELTAKECFRGETEAIGELDLQAAGEFLAGRSIDPGLGDLVRTCRSLGIDLRIVSDGLDFYIASILSAHGLGDLPFTSNRLLLRATEREGRAYPHVEFPHDDAECTRCACCKRNVMVTSASDDDVIVYAGDGFSDRCAVQYADMVFAKGELQTFCRENNISYVAVNHLHDVARSLESSARRGGFRTRRQAHLRRRALFMSEP